MPRGFLLLIAAQFTSALADNALLIVAIALLQHQGLPGWWAPLLKFSFTLSYVLLAPVVGPLADALPKARLMAWMNALKMLGLGGMLLPLHPVAAYAVVGLGAAAYSPAKYGILTELLPAERPKVLSKIVAPQGGPDWLAPARLPVPGDEFAERLLVIARRVRTGAAVGGQVPEEAGHQRIDGCGLGGWGFGHGGSFWREARAGQ